MSRRRKRNVKIRPTIGIVVDGDTEKWYFEMLKRNERRLQVAIKPELPKRNTLREQYDKVIELQGIGYDKVYWIVDMDNILKETEESLPGHSNPLNKFNTYQDKLLKKYNNITIVVNNPCLEFWFLLHYKRTGKIFRNCNSATGELKKHLTDYEKTRRYFTKQDNDIYLKLRPHLQQAIVNAKSLGHFDSVNPKKAMCEMGCLFEDSLLKEII